MIRRNVTTARTIGLTVLLFLAMPIFPLLSPSRDAQARPKSQSIIPDEVVVEIKPGASIDVVNQRNRTSTISRIDGTDFYRVRIPASKPESVWQKRLAADPDVLSASANPVLQSPLSLFGRRTMGFPDNHPELGHQSPEYNSQSALDKLDLGQAHVHSTGKGVVVAVIDTGVDITHPALAGHLWLNPSPNDLAGFVDDIHGWNFVDDNNDISEVAPRKPAKSIAGHGTFIAGLIALMAPDAQIMVLKAFPPSGVTNAFIVADAVRYAANHGASVINLSFGGSVISPVLADAIADAKDRGVFMAAAVGNDGEDVSIFPANSTDVTGVAAVDANDALAPFSNFGTDVAVVAPGVNVVSTFPGGNYAKWSGTSFAAPLTSAEGALILSSDLYTPDVDGLIKETAVSVDTENVAFAGELGKGRIDPVAALVKMETAPYDRAPRDVSAQLGLDRGPAELSAKGTVSVSITSEAQEIDCEAYNVAPRATYTLLVNGSPSGTVNTSNNIGSVSFDFASNPGPGQFQIPPALLPVTSVKQIQLVDMQGHVALEGTFGPPVPGVCPLYQTVFKETELTSSQRQIGGRAEAEVTNAHERLVIRAQGITGGTCQVLVDGVNLGLYAAQWNYVRVDLTSDGTGGSLLPAQLSPVIGITHVEVRDASGSVVLMQGDFQPGAYGIGTGLTRPLTNSVRR
ncbi:MAG TPA: S8 family serine peptidase [Blastocatellia bacterium]|nr:S8 family serine peptidase [Blastocatellia bacterium]